MKISLVNPPAVQSSIRGAGVYGREVAAALEKIPGVELSRIRPDLVHYLYFDPFFLTLPPFRPAKTVVTVFDLTPIVLPDLYPRGVRGEIKWQIQKNLLKTANHVITISESAKKDIMDIVGVPEQKITITYLAAGRECRPLKLKRDNSVVYIGDIDPNKNLPVLLKAISLLKDEKLVIIGKAAAQSPEIKKQIAGLGLTDRVTLTGYVSEEEKVKLLNRARVYVQPSLYEGFGLPVLEALACGTPVICGRNSSLPEIAGDAATYADVTDAGDLASKISNVRPTGREMVQAAKFSWEKTARETYGVYQKILGG